MVTTTTRHKTPIATTEQEIEALVTESAFESACLILTYVNGEGEVRSRGTWPVIMLKRGSAPVWTSKEGHRCFCGHDSLHDEVITYRVDRVVDAHRLEA